MENKEIDNNLISLINNFINSEKDKHPDTVEDLIKEIKEIKDIKDKTLEEKIIPAAYKLAYNDVKRTLTGIGDKKYDTLKEKVEENLVDGFCEYFSGNCPETEDEFNDKHNELCILWTDNNWNNAKLSSYGKAQKIVNMMFKYLYCNESLRRQSDYFKYCHMPLDSFTLEYYKRKIYKKDTTQIILGDIASWSKLNNSTYKNVSGEICDHLKNIKSSYTALQTEFKIWTEMQETIALENLYLILTPSATKTKFIEKDLSEKREMLKETLVELQNNKEYE